MESKKEDNKQILSNALKALRECKEVSSLSEAQQNVLTNANADDLYNAYLDIDTYFDTNKCFSIENPCCAYGLCAGGILTTAALCGTVMPCICSSISTTPNEIPYEILSGSGTAYYRGRGIGAVLSIASIPMVAPAVGGVLALCEHKFRAQDKENKIKQIADDTEQHNNGQQENIFLKKLKEIISFHSYYDTERNNIKNTIEKLCNSKQNYNKIPMEANNSSAIINNNKEKNNNNINKHHFDYE